MVPFATDPQDMSWCGIAFPYGSRDTTDFINVKYLFVKSANN